MLRSPRSKLIVGACLVVLVVGFLWALPEIVRRVALSQIPKQTGRAAVIEDIDLNLFTGRVAVKGFRLAERGRPDTFVSFDRLDVKLSWFALLRSHLRLVELALAGPSVHLVRTGPAEFNFSDLLPKPSQEEAKPSRWNFTVDRIALSRGRVQAEDQAVSPQAEWLIQDFGFEAGGITTYAEATPGKFSVRAKIHEAGLALDVSPLQLDPLRLEINLSFNGFEMRRLDPYVYLPLRTPYLPQGGRLNLTLTAKLDSDAAREVTRASVTGNLGIEGIAVAQTGRQDPFLRTSRVAVALKEADILTRSVTVSSVEIEGVDLKARRDAQGVIDLIQMFAPKTAAAGPASPTAPGSAPPTAATPPAGATAPAQAPPRRLFPILLALARGFDQIRIEKITLSPSTASFVDESVKPTTTLTASKLEARVDDFTWPVKGPAAISVSTGLPGGGTLTAKGTMTPLPFVADFALAMRDAPVTPYQAYIPVPARLSGLYGGDSQNHVEIRDGQLVALSKGNSWAQNVEIREPDGTRPVIRVERMDLAGIDFDWPKRATLARAGFRRLRVEVERDASGEFNVRRLFTAADEASPAAAAPPKPAPPAKVEKKDARPAEPEKSLLDTLRLDFREVRLEDGFIRFLDRTTTPAFSQDLSRLSVTVTDFGNRPNRRAKLVVQSVVGGDSALDIRGEIGPIGAPTYVDLGAELRSFKLTSVDPYAESAIGWAIKKGELQYKASVKLDGDQLTASNDIVVGQLQIAPAPASRGDEVKRRIGLPLGLIVALVKDQKGEIKVVIPVTGSVSDPKFDLSDAIWTAIKNVLVNVVTAPFKAIGRLFSGSGSDGKMEEPKVDPVIFAAGSATIAPDMEDHLLRVADFLRRTPFVNLSVTAVASQADVDALKREAVTTKLRDFQTAKKLRDSAVVAAYYKEHLPKVALPPTPEERLALLREREPVPESMLTDLRQRRVEATRQRLLSGEGIPETRVTAAEAAPAAEPAPTDQARVEFAIVAGG